MHSFLRQVTFLIIILMVMLGCNSNKLIVMMRPATIQDKQTTFYDFKLTSIDGSEVVDFSRFKGKKIIVMNVASKCGYTKQYADWEKFYASNKDSIVVLGFPSNEFLWQESGSNDKIASFCKLNYGVTFPMFEKTNVKGKDKCPLYSWLTDQEKNGWNNQEPKWNFCKYYIDETGKLVAYFSSKVKPDHKEFLKIIKS